MNMMMKLMTVVMVLMKIVTSMIITIEMLIVLMSLIVIFFINLPSHVLQELLNFEIVRNLEICLDQARMVSFLCC